jgi:hypothetical protein
MPVQKPGRSVQVVCTPDDFLAAFRERFGEIGWDLAANWSNTVSGVASFFGPGSVFGTDALTHDWSQLDGNLWLNPEFGDIEPWARKSCEEGRKGAKVNLFVPLSSSNWARDWCWSQAIVYPLNPRVTFKGHKTAYPKDMMLVRYGVERIPRSELWRWK